MLADNPYMLSLATLRPRQGCRTASPPIRGRRPRCGQETRRCQRRRGSSACRRVGEPVHHERLATCKQLSTVGYTGFDLAVHAIEVGARNKGTDLCKGVERVADAEHSGALDEPVQQHVEDATLDESREPAAQTSP